MPPEEMEAGISVTWEETDEEPFRPKAATTIVAELTPIERDEVTFYPPAYTDWYKTLLPPFIPKFPEAPEFEAPQKELVINIETTAVNPWESRIVCIGVLDPNALAPEAINFIAETEEKTLQQFLDWFETTTFDTLVGYNVSFDYRFLYAAMQRYRKEVPRWTELELYDLMQQQKQVKQAFVFGYNKPGKLEDWATYLFGAKPYATLKQVLKWIREGNIEEIVNFNTDKLLKAYYLWVLNRVVSGEIPGAEVLARPGSPEGKAAQETVKGSVVPFEGSIEISCPNCRQRQHMPKTAKVAECLVCGTPVPNPAL